LGHYCSASESCRYARSNGFRGVSPCFVNNLPTEASVQVLRQAAGLFAFEEDECSV